MSGLQVHHNTQLPSLQCKRFKIKTLVDRKYCITYETWCWKVVPTGNTLHSKPLLGTMSHLSVSRGKKGTYHCKVEVLSFSMKSNLTPQSIEITNFNRHREFGLLSKSFWYQATPIQYHYKVQILNSCIKMHFDTIVDISKSPIEIT